MLAEGTGYVGRVMQRLVYLSLWSMLVCAIIATRITRSSDLVANDHTGCEGWRRPVYTDCTLWLGYVLNRRKIGWVQRLYYCTVECCRRYIMAGRS